MTTLVTVILSVTVLLGVFCPSYYALDTPLPCNGYPQYKDLPANYFFWLGVHNTGLASYPDPHSAQARTTTNMLQDGIRHFDINLCTRNGETRLCAPHSTDSDGRQFASYLTELMDYIRQVFQQVVVLNINSIVEDDGSKATFADIESIIDNVCKQQVDQTLGTDDYIKYECPFIYVQPEYTMDWPTLGELVNYDPDAAAWEGDGEHVGVQSMLILTHGDSIHRHGGDMSHYFSKVFYRQSNPEGEAHNELPTKVRALCQSNGPIALQVYTNSDSKINDNVNLIEDTIFASNGCDINSASRYTYFNMIQLDQYHDKLPYLNDLQARMNEHNYAKLQGRIEPVNRSTKYNEQVQVEKQRPIRDEL